MAISKPNPEALKEVNAIKLTTEIKDFVNELSQEIDEERTHRAYWEKNVDNYINLRYGIRNKKTKPWPDCANFNIPLIDTDINRLKPSYVNLTAISPIVTFVPFGSEDLEPARKREVLFDWRMRTKVKFFEPYCYGIDKMLEQGAVVFETVWQYTTNTYTKQFDINELEPQIQQALYDPRVNDDILFKIIQEENDIDLDFEENTKEIQKTIDKFREGETEFELTLLEVKDNKVQVLVRDLRQDVVIPTDTQITDNNLDNARFIDIKIWTTVNDIKIKMRDEIYEEYPTVDLESWASKSQQVDKQGATTPQDDLVLLHRSYVWKDINDDGIMERCIAEWPDASPSDVLRFIELPYDHGQWPVTLVKRELNDPGVYSSRGIGALDEDYQIGITTAFNQSVDNGTIVNNPTIVTKRNTVTNVRNRRYIPGETVITNGPTADYEIRQAPNMSQGTLFQQAQYLKSWADQRLGNISSGLSNPTNMPGAGSGGKKTAKEVEVTAALQGQSQSLALQVFQQQMSRVYYQIDSLYDQFGDDVEEVLVTGQEPMKTSRSEIQGKFNMVPNGRLENTDPVIRANKNMQLLQMFGQDPDVKQYELKKIILDDYDSRVSGLILLTPKEIQQRDKAIAQQQKAMEDEVFGKSIKGEQVKNALEIEKEFALSQFQGAKFKEG